MNAIIDAIRSGGEGVSPCCLHFERVLSFDYA